jgi:hypothetical protein
MLNIIVLPRLATGSPIYQDRLGTNMGNVERERERKEWHSVGCIACLYTNWSEPYPWVHAAVSALSAGYACENDPSLLNLLLMKTISVTKTRQDKTRLWIHSDKNPLEFEREYGRFSQAHGARRPDRHCKPVVDHANVRC